jgi:hypothetical protein
MKALITKNVVVMKIGLDFKISEYGIESNHGRTTSEVKLIQL